MKKMIFALILSVLSMSTLANTSKFDANTITPEEVYTDDGGVFFYNKILRYLDIKNLNRLYKQGFEVEKYTKTRNIFEKLHSLTWNKFYETTDIPCDGYQDVLDNKCDWADEYQWIIHPTINNSQLIQLIEYFIGRGADIHERFDTFQNSGFIERVVRDDNLEVFKILVEKYGVDYINLGTLVDRNGGGASASNIRWLITSNWYDRFFRNGDNGKITSYILTNIEPDWIPECEHLSGIASKDILSVLSEKGVLKMCGR